MQLALSTWVDIQDYLSRSTGVIIPIGSTEQHGPTGLIGTDFICAETIAKGVGAETGALVTSTLTIGMAEHHTGFPGTLSLQPSTLILVVRDVVRSLAPHGFTHFFWINGHGGNIAVLRSAFTEIYQEFPQARCRLANWWMGKSIYQKVKELYADQEGSHATPSEVAVTMYAYPQAVCHRELPPAPSDTGIYSPQDFRQRYPDGRMGSNPSLATADHGAQFYRLAVTELSQQYEAFLRE